MRNNKVHIIILTISLMAILGIGIICTVNWIKNESILSNTTIVVSFNDGKHQWDVYKNKLNEKVTLVKDGSIQKDEVVNTAYKTERLSLIENTDLDVYDITKDKNIIENTWDSTITTSTKHIKYMESVGYSIISKASTPEYIEIYLQKESKYTRVIITYDNIIILNNIEYTVKVYKDYI